MDQDSRLNLIVICTDTLRADYLGCYGNRDVHTPNIDNLAAQGVVFNRAFAEGLPTLNARRIFFTGRHLYPGGRASNHKGDWLSFQPGWHGIDEGEVTLAEHLQQRGYTTCLVTDVYHMFKPTGNFHRGFDAWQWVRGQEQDPYVTGPREAVDISPYVKSGTYARRRFRGLEQYLLNTMDRTSEDDYFTARVLRTSVEWLRANAGNQPFFLWVDTFDPHEPWDPPRRWADAYCPDYAGKDFIAPPGDRGSYTDREWQRILALYMGEVSFLDEWTGRLLTAVEDLGLADRTVVALTSDHGTLLGEQGLLRKKHNVLIQGETRLPLVMRLPGGAHAGTRVDAFVQSPDFMPTWLGLLGESSPGTVTGLDVWPLVTGGGGAVRDWCVTAYGAYVGIRDAEWNYVRRVGDLYRGESDSPPQLYNCPSDPLEERNVVEAHADVVARMEARLAKRLAGDLGQRD